MPKLTIRISKLLYSRILVVAERERICLSEVARMFFEEALDRRQPGGGDPVTLDDLQQLAVKWERLIVAIFAIEQMVVRSLDPNFALLPEVGKRAIRMTEELLGTGCPKAAP